jgi:hypothetical protein
VVDLPELWSQLGVRMIGQKAIFDASAPLAGLRTAITAPVPSEQQLK